VVNLITSLGHEEPEIPFINIETVKLIPHHITREEKVLKIKEEAIDA
jgi:hypothetical protein